MPWIYVLQCGDNTFYVGHTVDLHRRFEQHACGLGGTYTSQRLPVDLVYYEECGSLEEALDRERQLKRWSAQKKAALVRGEFAPLKALAKRRRSR